MSAEKARMTAEEATRIIEERKAAALSAGAISQGKPFGPDNPDNVAKRDDRPPWDRGLRKVRIWDKEIPNTDGRLLSAFRTSEKCGVEDKAGKCQMLLIVTRAVNFKPEWDEYHIGMTLKYDFGDVRYYVSCLKHGPSPPGPEYWTATDK